MPTFEEKEPELREQLSREIVTALLAAGPHQGATIERFNLDGTPKPDAAPKPSSLGDAGAMAKITARLAARAGAVPGHAAGARACAWAALAAGLRYRGRDDLLLIELAPGTRSPACSPARPRRPPGSLVPRASWPRAGAGGARQRRQRQRLPRCGGRRRGAREAEAVAAALRLRAEEVFVASTGVIGERLPVEQIVAKVPELDRGPAARTASTPRAARRS